MAPRLSIVVPAYNEAHRLGEGMRRFGAAVASGAVDLEQTELVVVDDGSTDGTAATASALLEGLPHHRVVRHDLNRGKGAAVRTGIALARGAATAYMDADMAIDPQAIPLLEAGLGGHDVAIGSRALPDSMVESAYALRALMGRLFNRLVTSGTGLRLLDTQCGFKAFRTPAARLLFHLVRIDRFAFDVELLARARRLGLLVTEVPVHWKHVPGSTVHPLHDSLTMLADVYRSRLGLIPTPPVPTVTVRERDGSRPRRELADEVSAVVADTTGSTPLPVVAHGTAVSVLLPLVEPDDAGTVHAALRAELDPLVVSRHTTTFEELVALGPLTGRLGGPI